MSQEAVGLEALEPRRLMSFVPLGTPHAINSTNTLGDQQLDDFVQQLNTVGLPVGNPIQVDEDAIGSESGAIVAYPDGAFSVFDRRYEDSSVSSAQLLFMHRFDAAGNLLSSAEIARATRNNDFI